MSEHRASLEKNNVEAEPLHLRRRPPSSRGEIPGPGLEDSKSDKGSPRRFHRGSGDGMFAEETCRNTGYPAARRGESPSPKNKPRGRGSVLSEVGEAHSSEEAGNDRGAKGPQLQGKVPSKEGAGIGENLPPRNKLQELRETLHAKAKENPDYRFYSLYDKLHRRDVLWEAWQRSRANGGVPGPDGESFEQIEERGVSRWLEELTQELREKRYQPGAVLRVWIPKANGKQRPLGIPSIKDRVVQMAAVLILEPIFEADLQPEQHAYREGHNALQAVQEVHGWLSRGMREVVDADLSGYFDTIPHPELMKSLARRISDGSMLALLKSWLEMPVEEGDGKGGRKRSNPAKKGKKGTPQGSPISPLLANLYMRRFLLGWKLLGYGQKLKSRIVNYADDFVILCANTGKQAYEAMEHLMGKLKLEVNREKTRVCRVPEESFDFLGYTFTQCYKIDGGKPYIGTKPSRKKIAGVKAKISQMTERKTLWETPAEKVGELNALLRGWGNYFSLGTVSKAYREVDAHTRHRLRRWLCKKHKVSGRGTGKFPDQYLHEELGLYRLTGSRRNFPWAKA